MTKTRITAALLLVAVLAMGYWGLRHSGLYRRLRPSQRADEQLAEGKTDAPGRWRLARTPAPGGQLTKEQSEQLTRVMALPYLTGSTEAPGVKNVTTYDPNLAYNGLNLYTSGHAPAAFVADMNGKVLHTWHYAVDKIWPHKVAKTPVHGKFWRRAYWYPNGDILALFSNIGVLKLNKDSQIVWAYECGCHHQAFVAEDGRIYVLTREAQRVPRINKTHPILVDKVVILSPSGRMLEEFPLLECFENSRFKPLLKDMQRMGDIFHTNSIVVSDGTRFEALPSFRKGNVLISIWGFDTVAVVSLHLQEVLWALSGRQNGMWKRQHDAKMLPNGNMLLFDNLGRNGKSKVIEFNPLTQKIAWQYPADDQGEFFTKSCGICDRLPNGNTLMTESDNGRAIEVTPDGKTVWEFHNPFRAGKNNELIATLFEMVRVEKDFFPWLKVDQGKAGGVAHD